MTEFQLLKSKFEECVERRDGGWFDPWENAREIRDEWLE